MPTLGAIIMLGQSGHTPQEQLVAHAQKAATLDLLSTLQSLNITPIILCAPDLTWLPPDLDIWQAPDPSDRPFHFGSHLAEAIIANQLNHVFYFGGASAPLLNPQLFQLLLERIHHAIATKTRLVITNNLHSSDWVAITYAQDALSVIHAANRDNSLAWALRQDAKYETHILTERRPAAAFDLDTPTDLAILRQHPDLAPNLRTALNNPLLDSIPLRPVLDTLRTDGSHVALIGRVSPTAWQALSDATLCWIRVFSEERGMVASQRFQRGEVRSIIGALLDLQGPHQFFITLATIVDTAIIDTRVLMAHQGRQFSTADRFASDLFMPDSISDPWLRDFTEAAANAPIPVMLGGHSTVAGGLHVLSEILKLKTKLAH
jgi:hypothetical protein